MKVDLQEEKQRTKKIGYISGFLVKFVFGIMWTAFNLYIPIFITKNDVSTIIKRLPDFQELTQ